MAEEKVSKLLKLIFHAGMKWEVAFYGERGIFAGSVFPRCVNIAWHTAAHKVNTISSLTYN